MLNMELLNDTEKELIKIDRKINIEYLKNGNILTFDQLKEIEHLPHVKIKYEGKCIYNSNLKWYSIELNHKYSEIDIETTSIFIR